MIVDRWLRIDFDELTRKQWVELERALTYENGNGDLVISFRRLVTKGCYIIPRGAWYLLPDSITYTDKRSYPEHPALEFKGVLDNTAKDPRYAGQEAAVREMFKQEQGLVIRPPGTGKTEIACAFAARAETKTLVLVHTEDILVQWVERIRAQLGIEPGVIRGKECRIEQITVATVQTLSRSYLKESPGWWAQWGCLIADEGHHVAAQTWEAVINACPARYRFAFTASATRADGMHPSMKFIIGPVIHKQKFSSPVKVEVRPVKTNFNEPYRGPFDWGNLLNKLVADEDRNTQIAEVIDGEIAEGNSILVLSRRIEHLERIADAMLEDAEILTGRRSKKERQDILARFRSGKLRCLLATQLADEALDVPRLSRICLTHPGKHEGRIIQQIGRALRVHASKRDAVIYDFIDPKVGVLRHQWSQRKATYKKLGIKVKSTGRVTAWR